MSNFQQAYFERDNFVDYQEILDQSCDYEILQMKSCVVSILELSYIPHPDDKSFTPT